MRSPCWASLAYRIGASTARFGLWQSAPHFSHRALRDWKVSRRNSAPTLRIICLIVVIRRVVFSSFRCRLKAQHPSHRT